MNARGQLAALNQAIDFDVSDAFSEEGVFDLSGTFVATLVVEGSVDGQAYRALELTPVAGGAGVTSVTAPGAWRFNLAGLTKARVQASAYTSGTAVVGLQISREAA